MVQRKSSLPYPTSPPPPAPSFEPSTQSAHHDVYTNDLPPVPHPARADAQSSSNFEDMGNPWQDDWSSHRPNQQISTQPATSSIPDPLKPGLSSSPNPSAPKRSQTNLDTLPEALRPGRSGDATPRSSLDSDRSPDREWWDDDPFEEMKGKGKQPELDTAAATGELHVVNNNDSSNNSGAPLPSPGGIKRKPVATSTSAVEAPQPLTQQYTGAPAFSSNNPFRRPSETFLHAPTDLPDWGAEIKEKEALSQAQAQSQPQPQPQSEHQPQPQSQSPYQPHNHPHPLRSSPSTDALGNLNLSDSSIDQQPLPSPVPTAPTAPPPPPPPAPVSAPPPPPPSSAFTATPQHEELLPPTHQRQQQHDYNTPWTNSQTNLQPTPSPLPFDPSQQHVTVSSENLLDRGQNDGAIGLGDELKVLSNAAPASAPPPKPTDDDVSLLEDDEPHLTVPKPAHPDLSSTLYRQESEELYAPPAGPPPSRSMPPMKPPRPAVVTSEVDLAKMQEQRNETYQIKHFNWYDLSAARMRRSSMLVQNQNGPCPLLALVNALILGAGADTQASLDDALNWREQVSLGLIIETLMDELLTKAATIPGLELPEIDELNRFLLRLKTGMNANPRFIPPKENVPNLMDEETIPARSGNTPTDVAGTFEATQDIKLYRSFAVKLLHGWLPRPGDQAAQAFTRSAQTYEDAQAVQFGEEELEYKLSHGGLSQQEQNVWEDITSIKQFFTAYPTQLTPFGLSAIRDALHPGEFAILFRNDHFSTIYKHPQHQSLYTLVTDAGFADRDEIIWESLQDISGARTSYFSGDFQSVSHGDSHHPIPHSMTDAANPRRASTRSFMTANEQLDSAMTPQAQQEQHDADFAMALQLQEEEEQRMRQERSQAQNQGRQGGGGIQPSPPVRPPRSARGNIPIPLRSQNEQRPVIPPRNQPRNQGVTRPADANDADAPPVYEEAVRTAVYNPPIGSPLHPSSTNDLPSTSTSYVNASGQSTGTTTGMRRTSAYNDHAGRDWGHTPDYSAGIYGPNSAFTSPGGDGRRRVDASGRERDRDCVVM